MQHWRLREVKWCLSKVGAYLDANEVHTAFLGHGSGQQGLSCPRSSVQQYSGAVADRQFGEQDGILSKSRDGWYGTEFQRVTVVRSVLFNNMVSSFTASCHK